MKNDNGTEREKRIEQLVLAMIQLVAPPEPLPNRTAIDSWILKNLSNCASQDLSASEGSERMHELIADCSSGNRDAFIELETHIKHMLFSSVEEYHAGHGTYFSPAFRHSAMIAEYRGEQDPEQYETAKAWLLRYLCAQFNWWDNGPKTAAYAGECLKAMADVVRIERRQSNIARTLQLAKLMGELTLLLQTESLLNWTTADQLAVVMNPHSCDKHSLYERMFTFNRILGSVMRSPA